MYLVQRFYQTIHNSSDTTEVFPSECRYDGDVVVVMFLVWVFVKHFTTAHPSGLLIDYVLTAYCLSVYSVHKF